MALKDPDPNFQITHGHITWSVDPIGDSVNAQYRLEVNEEFKRQLTQYRYPDLLQACQKVSMNLVREPAESVVSSPCDIQLNLPAILDSLDESASLVYQQAQVSEKLEEQLQTIPRVDAWVKYTCLFEKPTFSVSMHALHLNISNAVFQSQGQTWGLKEATYDPQQQIVQFFFDKELPANQQGEFIVEFHFELGSHWFGMYVVNPDNLPPHEESTMKTHQELLKYHQSLLKSSLARIVCTQFESVGARRAMPCIDMPTRKFPWTVRVIGTASIDTCWSNMVLKEHRILSSGNGLQLWEFEPTPPLPTYLLCVVLATRRQYIMLKREVKLPAFSESTQHRCFQDCPHQCYEKRENVQNYVPVTLRIMVPPAKIKEATHALKSAVDVFVFLWSFFRVTLPLRKLDLVSLPFLRPGAMENYGITTYREDELVPEGLHESEVTSLQHQLQIQGSTKIIAHELAHQWTGDLVTCQGWPELWVNESFASFCAYKTVEAIRPEWGVWARFLANDVKVVQETDWTVWNPALQKQCVATKGQEEQCSRSVPFASNRSVVTPHYFFHDTTHIDAVFDTITYSKGAALIRGVETLIGEKEFQIAVHGFIHQNTFGFGSFEKWNQALNHSCAHCRPVPLYTVLTEVDKKMATEKHSASDIFSKWWRQPGFPIVSIEVQENKLEIILEVRDAKGEKVQEETNPFVPLFNVDGIVLGPSVREWHLAFRSREALLDFLRINRNGTGFYVTRYNEQGYLLLAEMISTQKQKLSRLDKVHLLVDLFFNLRRGWITLQTVTKVVLAFQHEQDHLVVLVWFLTLREITGYFRFLPKMSDYCRWLTQQFFENLVTTSDMQLVKAEVDSWTEVSGEQEPVEDISLKLPAGEEDPEESKKQVIVVVSPSVVESEGKVTTVTTNIDNLLQSLANYLSTAKKAQMTEPPPQKQSFSLAPPIEEKTRAIPFHPQKRQKSMRLMPQNFPKTNVLSLQFGEGPEGDTQRRTFSQPALRSLMKKLWPQATKVGRHQTWMTIMNHLNESVRVS